jgi:hypothetical protein
MNMVALYYHRSLPTALVVQLDNGSLWIRNSLIFSTILEKELTPYRGYRQQPPLMPVPSYLSRFYGMEAANG